MASAQKACGAGAKNKPPAPHEQLEPMSRNRSLARYNESRGNRKCGPAAGRPAPVRQRGQFGGQNHRRQHFSCNACPFLPDSTLPDRALRTSAFIELPMPQANIELIARAWALAQPLVAAFISAAIPNYAD